MARPAPPNPDPDAVGKLLDWEALDSWLTPADNFFTINHYGPTGRRRDLAPGRRRPGRAAAVALARRPAGSAAPRGGVHAGVLRQPRLSRSSSAAIGNARWAGTPLAPLLERAGVCWTGHRGRLLGRRRGTGHDRRQRRRAGAGNTGDGGPRRHRRRRPDDHRAVRAQHVARGRARPRQPALLRDERRAAAGRPRLPAAADRAGLVRRGQRQVADAHRGAGPALRGPVHGARLRDDPRAGGATGRPSGRSTPSGTTG